MTPLRSLDEGVLSSAAHLFTPRPAYRFQPIYAIKTGGFGAPAGGSNVTGRNPRYGADINIYLQETPDEPMEIRFIDAGGETLRTLSQDTEAGINRIWWDLRYEPTEIPKLRIPPPGRPWVPLGDEGWRPLVTWDLDLWRGQLGPLAPPGEYRVEVTVGDRELTESVTVLKDPHSAGTETDISAQVAFSLELRDDLNEVVGMINRIEWLRKQLGDLERLLKDKDQGESVLDAAGELADSAISVEGRLFDVNMTGAREDAFRGPMKL